MWLYFQLYRKTFDAKMLTHLGDDTVAIMKMLYTKNSHQSPECPIFNFEWQFCESDKLKWKNTEQHCCQIYPQLCIPRVRSRIAHLCYNQTTLCDKIKIKNNINKNISNVFMKHVHLYLRILFPTP